MFGIFMFSFGLVYMMSCLCFIVVNIRNYVEEACFEGKMAVCFSCIDSIVLILVVEECP